jgi:hypothetical protein
VLVLAAAVWLFSMLSIFSIGVFVAPAAIPLSALGAAIWPSRTHLVLGTIGVMWGVGALILLAVAMLSS